MAVGEGSSEPENNRPTTPQPLKPTENEEPIASPDTDEEEEEEEEEEDEGEDEDEEEEEPRLKYAPLTKNLGTMYRNGDATSAFIVAGDKLIIGTHDGKIHVYSMPMLQSLRNYRAHSASVSSVSISPNPPPLSFSVKLDATQRLAAESATSPSTSPSSSPRAKNTPRQPPVPRTPSNDIYIATSSIDGHVCVMSLIDEKDVQLRNFGRPVHAVALSPDFKSDKTYLSGGQEGSLILTVGGSTGKMVNATTLSTSAATAGWLGSIGLGSNTGTDKVLHSGEGIISTIKWSRSGKYVIWANEHGIKIMRSHLKLEASETGLEWKRISHVSRPNRTGWEEMAAVQRARAEWVDRANLDSDDDPALRRQTPSNGNASKPPADADTEDVVVGWGDMTWIIRVSPASKDGTKDDLPAGRAEVIQVIRFADCMIAGVSLYTPTLLLVLAYMEKKKRSGKSKKDSESTPRSRAHRNALKPELRLIDINSKEEVETDALPVGRFESLSSSDYHLGVLYPIKIPAQLAQKGYLGQIGSGAVAVGSGLVTGVETVGQGVWDATMYGPRMLGANRLFQSDTGSIRGLTRTDSERSPAGGRTNYLTGWIPGLGSSIFGKENEDLKAVATTQGMKIFLLSPYDCIVAVKRNLTDRVQWLEKTQRYQKAWELLDEFPQAAGTGTGSDHSEASSPPETSKASSVDPSTTDSVTSPARQPPKPSLAEFFADSASIAGSQVEEKSKYSLAEKEKRRIGELWLSQLVKANKWSEAGEVAGRVLNTTTRWEHWVWVFIRNKKFDEISPYIPAMELTPPLSSSIFEVFLGHYVSKDSKRFQELVDLWPSDLFEISSVTTAIQDQLSSGSVAKESTDWRLLMECLAKLYLADGHYSEALRCYISLQDADTAMSLVKDNHLVEAIVDDIPGFVLLRITRQQLKTSSNDELEELSSDPIKLLVDEASRGVIEPDFMVRQLNKPDLRLFLFLYFKYLWRGTGRAEAQTNKSRHRFSIANLATDEGKMLVDGYPDLAVELFAEYDRSLLMEFLHVSTLYDFSTALKVCEKKKYYEEEVYLLSKTGSLKKALYLIIDELQDVSKAIAFAKEQDDKGLWEDLLEYSMSRPRFISGLLSEVGTAIDPIRLIKRIPSGIEIQGLKDGLKKILREYDLQDSISSGAAKILSSEVAVNQAILRRGRRRGIKFDVPSRPQRLVRNDTWSDITATPETPHIGAKPGHCAKCDKAFTGDETGTLIGFACGHVYHVSCLLGNAPTTKGDQEEEDDGIYGFTRSIGTKVTNARLLRDRVRMEGGCTICLARHKAEEE